MDLKSRLVIATLSIGISMPGLAAHVFFQEPVPRTAPEDQSGTFESGTIEGTVTDQNGDLVAGATVVVEGAGTRSTTVADADGVFSFREIKADLKADVKAGTSYRVTVSAKGFEDWVSPPIALTPGGFVYVKDIRLRLAGAVTSVTVNSSTEQIAMEQVAIEEKQRIFGIIPNFYVVYDSENAVPLTTRLKFKMALRDTVDPVSFLGAATLAGIDQAADNPGYMQGARGYAERFGSVYGDGFTDTMIGGAILPSLLHQDPRYFYKGTGTIRSRVLYAMAAPFICKGDKGKWQPNVSSIGGDLISASISMSYYPQSDRGASLLFENLLIETAERSASTLIQEFLLRKWTPSANGRN